MKLTPQTISAAIKEAVKAKRRLELPDDEVKGLVLRVSGDHAEPGVGRGLSRSGTWSVRVIQPSGKRVRVPIGSYAEVSIGEARKTARAVKERGRAGEVVSAAERREAAKEVERKRIPLRTHLVAYTHQKLDALRSGANARRSIELLLGSRLNDEPAVLSRAVFASLIDARAKQAPVSANRALAYTRPFLKWLVMRGHLTDNPARDFAKPTKEFPRERTPTLAEIIEIRSAAIALGYPFGHFFQALLLTAGRRDEVAEMKLSELDLENPAGAVWNLPSTRSKNGRGFRVPLSKEAVSVLREAIALRPVSLGVSQFVFSTTGVTPISGWARAKRSLDRTISEQRQAASSGSCSVVEPMEPWNLHDLRRGFATAAVDILHLDPGVIDRCLNHVAAGSSSVVARVYQRSEMLDQRRAALDSWGVLIAPPPS